jgi:hypothetical protein
MSFSTSFSKMFSRNPVNSALSTSSASSTNKSAPITVGGSDFKEATPKNGESMLSNLGSLFSSFTSALADTGPSTISDNKEKLMADITNFQENDINDESLETLSLSINNSKILNQETKDDISLFISLLKDDPMNEVQINLLDNALDSALDTRRQTNQEDEGFSQNIPQSTSAISSTPSEAQVQDNAMVNNLQIVIYSPPATREEVGGTAIDNNEDADIESMDDDGLTTREGSVSSTISNLYSSPEFGAELRETVDDIQNDKVESKARKNLDRLQAENIGPTSSEPNGNPSPTIDINNEFIKTVDSFNALLEDARGTSFENDIEKMLQESTRDFKSAKTDDDKMNIFLSMKMDFAIFSQEVASLSQ